MVTGADWRSGAGHRAIEAAFAGVAQHDGAALVRAATGLFAAVDWLGLVLDPLIAAVRADPWCDLPLKVNREAHRCGAILYARNGVTITLSHMSAAGVRTAADAPTVICSGKLAVTRYVHAGGAVLQRWQVPPLLEPLTTVAIRPCRRLGDRALMDGDVVHHDGRHRAQILTAATAGVVMLSAAIDADADPVAREYERGTGRFVRKATNDEGAARAQLLLALLRAGERPDAHVFDAATRDGAFFLRWSAMREWLACDWRAAWPRLREMATSDPHPEIRDAAAATIDRLTLKAA